jgi:hypothetical protein
MATFGFIYGVGRWCVFVNGKIIARCATYHDAQQVAEDYNELHRK